MEVNNNDRKGGIMGIIGIIGVEIKGKEREEDCKFNRFGKCFLYNLMYE